MPMNFNSWLSSRSKRTEKLDDEHFSARDLKNSLDFMVFVNRFFGGRAAVLHYFNTHRTPESFTVLDLGSGSGDIPWALAQWARANGKSVKITALDLNPDCHSYARSRFSDLNVNPVVGSAMDMESLGDFDYVTSSMFFHHLPDEVIIRLLRMIDRQSRRGFVISDLRRCYLNLAGAALLAGFTFHGATIHDAVVSVLRGFTEKDCASFRERSGLDFEIKALPWFRMVMCRHD